MVIIKSDINKMLLGLLSRQDLVDLWWSGTNRAFDGKTPNEVYLSGEDGRKAVYNYVASFCSGDYL